MRKKTTLLGEILTLPWWINLILAAIVYVGLKSWLPTLEINHPFWPGIRGVLPQFANLFAGILVLAAVVSAYHSWRKRRLLESQTSVESIKSLSWEEFESLVGEAYRRRGYAVEENSKPGADGGVDLVLRKGRKKTLVQCKNWCTRSVGVPIIRELYGVVTAENAAKGIIVCSGRYTKEAIEFARGKPLTLIGGTDLLLLIGDVQKRPKTKVPTKILACPVCGKPMVLRTAKKGKNSGGKFWGCSQYPRCRGIRVASI